MKIKHTNIALFALAAPAPHAFAFAFQTQPLSLARMHTSDIATRTTQPQPQPLVRHNHNDQHYHDPFRRTNINMNININANRKKHQYLSTRLYRGTNPNDQEKKSFLQKATEKVKSMNPFSKSKSKSSSQLTQKEKAKEDISSGIDTMLKDAPLGLKLMGKMIKPIVGSLVGSMAQAMEEQQQQLTNVIQDARNLIVQDPAAVQLLGEPVEMGSTPFSQSSSTMSVNGETRSNVQASLEVRGGRASGVVTISSVNGKIESLMLNVGGRNIAVDVTKSAGSGTGAGTGTDASYTVTGSSFDSASSSSSSSGGIGKNRNVKDDDIIDAEFVEKK